MMSLWRATGLSAVLCLGLVAQTPPAFEVASVRPAQGGGGRGGRGGFGMILRSSNIHIAPGALTLRAATLRTCVRWAYHVPDFQVTGPDWIDQQRYDIVAKAPADASEDQLRAMLQTLLAERFKVVVHRQPKETQSWILTVGKGGPKFKESAGEGEGTIQPDLQKMQIGIQRTSVADLIDLLSNLLRAPILDETGLKGRYDITIDIGKYLPDQSQPVDMLATVVTGIQQELGLKLESRKMPLDLVVIDSAEKTPAEN
jgi:uncharacterized protein (TIGR03435 family)